jgi:uncharacterized membrane protein
MLTWLGSVRSPFVLTGIVIAVFLQLLNARGLFSGYSYWNDEAFSAATSLASWKTLFFGWVLPDTAPPLYPVFLKIWQSLVGYNEITARFLSFIFSTSSLILISSFSLKSGRASYILTVLFMGTSPIFSRYGQEARNYSLVLLLSVLSLTSLVDWYGRFRANLKSDRSEYIFRVSIILLSLTHYFAFLYCIALLGFKMLCGLLSLSKYKGELLRDVANTILIIAFPLYHLVFFRQIKSTTLLAWNHVQPFWGTLKNLNESLLSSANNNIAISIIIILLVFSAFAIYRFSSPIQIRLAVIIASSLIFVSLVTFVDLITKSFSTDRNFIVILPAATLTVSYIGQGIASSIKSLALKLVILFLFVFLIIQQFNVSANNMLYGKLVPYENYKQVAIALGKSEVCKSVNCYSYGVGKWWNDVYFRRQSVKLIDISDINISLVSPGSIVVLSASYSESSLVLNVMKEWGYSCLQPIQAWDQSVVVFAPSHVVPSLIKYNLSASPLSR